MLTEEEIRERIKSPEIQSLIDSVPDEPPCEIEGCPSSAMWLLVIYCAISYVGIDYLVCQGHRNFIVNLGDEGLTANLGHEHKIVGEKLLDA